MKRDGQSSVIVGDPSDDRGKRASDAHSDAQRNAGGKAHIPGQIFLAKHDHGAERREDHESNGQHEDKGQRRVCYQGKNGQETMAKITGSGCMSSVLMGAFFGVEQSIKAAVTTCVWMGIAGEVAYERTRKEQGGTMTFRMKLIDAISLMDEKTIQEKMKLCLGEEG